MKTVLHRLAMTLALLLATLAASAYDFKADGIYYNITTSDPETNTYEVEVTYWSYSGNSGYKNTYSGDITVPSTVYSLGQTYNVTSIGVRAFCNSKNLTSVTIPNSVTSIQALAFEECRDLTAVIIPNSVVTIGHSAFYGCYNMESIDLPSSITTIEDYVFQNCGGLTSLLIPSSVDTIGKCAFNNCRSLTSLVIPNSVTTIGDNAFAGCSGLTSVTISNSVTIIGDGAFKDCRGLTSLVIPNSVTTIGNNAFASCNHLTSVTIPNSVTTIGNNAFEGCIVLASVSIPSSVTTIRGGAFKDCRGLTSLVIPSSVTTIGNNAFEGCSGLTSVTIPNSVTTIGDNAFEGCSGLNSVTIPSSVTTIGGGAFKSCTNLTSADIQSSSIGSYMFIDCTKLTSVTIHDSVTSIGYGAFNDCTGLTSLDIPSSVKSIYNSNIFCNYNVSGHTFFYTKICRFKSIITMEGQPPLLDTHEGFIIPSYDDIYYLPNRYDYYTYIDYRLRFSNGTTLSWTTQTSDYHQSHSIINESSAIKFKLTLELDAYDPSIDSEISTVHYNIDHQIIDTGTSLSCELDNIDAPNTAHKLYNISIHFTNGKYWQYSLGTYGDNYYTPSPSFGNGEATATSSSSARLMSTVNLPDGTIGGFEWRRDNAPSGMKSTKAPCPVMDGRLTGSLRNLKDDVYYKCRPYYIDINNKEYYGDWFYVFTGDAGVYFEPEVRTFTPEMTSGEDGSCTVSMSGYALPGSDDILAQGFEYRSADGGGQAAPSRADGNWIEVAASGIMMDATLTNLSPATDYLCRAFVTTANGRFTGEEIRFTTPGDAGVDTIPASASEPEIVGYYNLQGVRLASPAPGLNIVVYSDGSTRKVLHRP